MPRNKKPTQQTNAPLLTAAATENLEQLEQSLAQEAQEFIDSRPKVQVQPKRSSAINSNEFVGGNVGVKLDRFKRSIRLQNIITEL